MPDLASIISNIKNCIENANKDLDKLENNNNKITTDSLNTVSLPFGDTDANVIKPENSYGGKTGRKHRRGKKTRRNKSKTARRNR